MICFCRLRLMVVMDGWGMGGSNLFYYLMKIWLNWYVIICCNMSNCIINRKCLSIIWRIKCIWI